MRSKIYKYTNVELAERKKALRDMERDYPNLPFQWLEMVYDFNKNTPDAEVKEIINEGRWEVPGNFTSTLAEKENGNEKENENKIVTLT